MTKILLSGDSHADVNHVKSMAAKAERFECEKIFVLGDFGWWPKDKGGLKFLDACSKLDLPVYFLPGNHEDWESLDELQKSSTKDSDGFYEIYDNIFYAPTGHRWQWDEVKFLAVGGAYSIDRRFRIKYISWFPQEIITETDLAYVLENPEPVDVVFSHDAPHGVDMAKQFVLNGDRMIFEYDEGTLLNMVRLKEICDTVQPKHLFHGHWHLNYSDKVDYMQVTGLNCNTTPDYYWVLDTEDLNAYMSKGEDLNER